ALDVLARRDLLDEDTSLLPLTLLAVGELDLVVHLGEVLDLLIKFSAGSVNDGVVAILVLQEDLDHDAAAHHDRHQQEADQERLGANGGVVLAGRDDEDLTHAVCPFLTPLSPAAGERGEAPLPSG